MYATFFNHQAKMERIVIPYLRIVIPYLLWQTLLVSLFPDEWEHFCERVGVLTMLTQLPESAHAALQQWASDRAQVLSRTVRGMMRYGDGLRVLARLEGVPEEDIEMVRDTAVY